MLKKIKTTLLFFVFIIKNCNLDGCKEYDVQ